MAQKDFFGMVKMFLLLDCEGGYIEAYVCQNSNCTSNGCVLM